MNYLSSQLRYLEEEQNKPKANLAPRPALCSSQQEECRTRDLGEPLSPQTLFYWWLQWGVGPDDTWGPLQPLASGTAELI